MLRYALAALALGNLAAPASAQVITPADSVSIAVVAPEEHPAVEGCLAGIRAGLEELGFAEGSNLELRIEAATEDDIGVAATAALEGSPRVVVAISTEAAKAVAEQTADMPVVFCAVADPVGAGLAEGTMRPGGNVTGVSDLTPLSQHLGLINEVLPEVRTLGVIFDPEDATSTRLMDRLREFAPGAGFTLVEAEIDEPGELGSVVADLADEAQAIYLTAGEIMDEGLDGAIEAAVEARVPLFAGDVSWVERGAIGALGFDYEELGRQTAAVINRIFAGENPANIPITQAESTVLYVNARAAEAMGLQLSPGFIARADEIIE